MDKLELATSILGLLARGAQAAWDAIRAATTDTEAEAVARLEDILRETAITVGGLKEKIAKNKSEALKELHEKFPEKVADNRISLETLASASWPDDPTKPD